MGAQISYHLDFRVFLTLPQTLQVANSIGDKACVRGSYFPNNYTRNAHVYFVLYSFAHLFSLF